MRIDLQQVTERELPVVHNLSLFYRYDISEISDHEWYSCRENGLYEGGCERYKLEHCDIHLIRVDAELAGFTIAGPDYLTKDRHFPDAESINTIWEFFILRRFRRRRLGTQVAHRTFDRYPGPWYVPVWTANAAAVRFWQHTIAQYTDTSTCTPETVEDHAMLIHRFRND